MQTAFSLVLLSSVLLLACGGATSGASSRPAIGASKQLHEVGIGGYWSYVIDPNAETCLLKFQRNLQAVTMAPVDCGALAENHEAAAEFITWEAVAPAN